MRIKLSMDRDRAIMLMHACECMARIGMQQFKSLVELLSPDMSYEDGLEIEKYLKEKLSKLPMNGYNAVRSVKVPTECQVAWDAYQWLRREISWQDRGMDWRKDKREWNGPDSMMGVNYDEPFKVSRLDGDFNTEKATDE
jgi:hypothetical protein